MLKLAVMINAFVLVCRLEMWVYSYTVCVKIPDHQMMGTDRYRPLAMFHGSLP